MHGLCLEMTLRKMLRTLIFLIGKLEIIQYVFIIITTNVCTLNVDNLSLNLDKYKNIVTNSKRLSATVTSTWLLHFH